MGVHLIGQRPAHGQAGVLFDVRIVRLATLEHRLLVWLAKYQES
jgi:hypothetical protein